jgi:hypothetical protein
MRLDHSLGRLKKEAVPLIRMQASDRTYHGGYASEPKLSPLVRAIKGTRQPNAGEIDGIGNNDQSVSWDTKISARFFEGAMRNHDDPRGECSEDHALQKSLQRGSLVLMDLNVLKGRNRRTPSEAGCNRPEEVGVFELRVDEVRSRATNEVGQAKDPPRINETAARKAPDANTATCELGCQRRASWSGQRHNIKLQAV